MGEGMGEASGSMGGSGSMMGGAVSAGVAGTSIGAGASNDGSFDEDELALALALSLEVGESASLEAAGVSMGSLRTAALLAASCYESSVADSVSKPGRRRGPGP